MHRTSRLKQRVAASLFAVAIVGGGLAVLPAAPATAATTTTNFAAWISLDSGIAVLSQTADASISPSQVVQGDNFTLTEAGSTQTIPTSNGGVPVVYATNNNNMYAVPAGAQYVSSSNGTFTFTPSVGATVTGTETVTYCDPAAGPLPAACTGTPQGVHFLSSFAAAPYLEVGTGAAQFSAGGTLTTTAWSATFKATGTGTINQTWDEFQTTAAIFLGGSVVSANIDGYPTSVTTSPCSALCTPSQLPPLTTSVIATTSSAAKPAVAALVPNAGPLAGGTAVTIHGSGLSNPTAVTFGGTPATSFTPLTANSIRAVAPPGAAGTADVVVTTPVGVSPVVPADLFTYTDGPIVTDVQPRVGPPAGGAQVTITGLQLTGATGVSFGGTPATSFTVNSDTSITAVAPKGSGVVDVTVTGPKGTSPKGVTTRYSYLSGYRLVASDGGVFSYGNAPFYGSTGGMHLNAPVVGMASTPDGAGYWLVASDGGVFAYGDATFYGSTGGMHLNAPVVGIAPSPNGFGYWLVAADGGVFAFGSAEFHGSAGSIHLNAPMVGIARVPDGGGYWLVASDGGIFAYGDAVFHGSLGDSVLRAPAVAATSVVPEGGGYWITMSDGGVSTFGNAVDYGSLSGLVLNKPVVGTAATSDGKGYWLAAADGGVFAYGDATFAGSTGGMQLNAPVVGISGS